VTHLGQAKWIPGQIAFQTTPSGRLPSLQPLIEAGLPYAPYIEHGSYVTGQPDIARYGRDPYRGISGLGQPMDERVDAMQQAMTDAVTGTIRATLPPTVMIATGVATGAAAGLAGGLLGKTVLGTLLGAAGGGVLGYLGWRFMTARAGSGPARDDSEGVAGLAGIPAVL
jgi:hypothetical protein